MVDILNRILKMRTERHWTEYELGKRADISQSTISTWYRKKQLPNLATLDKLSSAFGITLSQLVAEDGELVELSREGKEVLNLYQCLTLKQRKLFMEFMDSLIHDQIQEDEEHEPEKCAEAGEDRENTGDDEKA